MSDDHAHAEKVHPLAAVIMVAILAVLMALLIGLMNEGLAAALTISGIAFGAFGLYAVFGMGKVDAE